jgi:hypothetical protein
LALTYGQSARSIAEQFGFAYDCCLRHSKRHLSPSQRAALLAASRPSEIDVEALTRQESQGLLAHLVAMRARLQAHAQACAAQGNLRGAILAERVQLATLELGARVVGRLINHTQVTHAHLTLTPSYLNLREALIRILRPHPEIAAEVAAALAAIETAEGQEITAAAAKAQPMIEHRQAQP